MLNLNLIMALFCYLLVNVFVIVVYYNQDLKIYWSRIKIFLYLGFAAHTIALCAFSVIKNHFPITTNIEALLFMSWLLVPLMLFIEWRNKSIIMSAILLPFVLLSLLAVLVSDSAITILNPKLRCYWMYIHIPSSLIALIFLFISFGTSIMYLMQDNAMKLKKKSLIYDKLPSLAQSRMINSNSLFIGFILISVGMISGMLWSKACFGKVWQWDIKEILTAITWFVYAIILSGKFTFKWNEKIVAYLSIIGFLLILLTFFGFKFISKSYHSF